MAESTAAAMGCKAQIRLQRGMPLVVNDPETARICRARAEGLLGPEQDEYFPKFNVDGLLRGDYQSRMQGYATGISNGFLSPNDIRRLENMNLIPAEKGGDDYYLNGGYVKLQDAGKNAAANTGTAETKNVRRKS